MLGLDPNCNGTPLARRWNPFHYGPRKWSLLGERPEEDSLHVMRHYRILDTALAATQKHVDGIFVCKSSLGGVSPFAFAINDVTRLDGTGVDIAALSGSKRLCLCVEGDGLISWDNIEGLSELLASMHLLQQLELDVTWTQSHCPFTHDQVFPQAMTWNNLERFTLTRFSSDAAKLLCLLLIQMPGLKLMEFGDVILQQGRWETVIECLKQTNRSTIYKFRDNAVLTHRAGRGIRQDMLDINEYIMHGGRHPCLLEDQPTSASEEYMFQIDAPLRDRLLETRSYNPCPVRELYSDS